MNKVCLVIGAGAGIGDQPLEASSYKAFELGWRRGCT